MYFQAPPSGAARALLEQGPVSQTVVRRQPRPKVGNPVTKQPVNEALKTSHMGSASAPELALAAKRAPVTPKASKEKVPEELKKLETINSRVNNIIQQFDAEPQANELQADDDGWRPLGPADRPSGHRGPWHTK